MEKTTTLNGFAKVLGAKIKYLRLKNGLTHEKLAELLGYSVGMISRIERGEKSMSMNKINEAAKLFGIHPAFLLSPIPLVDDDIEMAVNLMELIKQKNENPHYEAVRSLLNLSTKK